MVNQKDFNAIVYTGNENIGANGFVKYRKQTNLSRLKNYLNSKYPNWKFMTIYDRKTNSKELIKRTIQPFL